MSTPEDEFKCHPGMERLRLLRDSHRKAEVEMKLQKQKEELRQEQENICVSCNPRQSQKLQRFKIQKPAEDKETRSGNDKECRSRGMGCRDSDAIVKKVVDEGNERSRSARLPSHIFQEEVPVVTLDETDPDETTDGGNAKNAGTGSFKLDQNSAIGYMATPVVNRTKEDKVVFHPTFLTDDGKYIVLQRLGSGAYGNVYKVKDSLNGKIRALKVMRNDRTVDAAQLECITREISALTTIRKKNPPASVTKVIVRLLQTYRLKDHQCILYELLGPTLHDVMRNDTSNAGWNWKEIKQISYQMLVAINYLHSLELVHHDIKPENVCFRSEYEMGCGMTPHIKLLDFGSCVSVYFRHGTIATTMRYRAPEIGLRGNSGYGVDMWSLGCCFFEIYTRYPLFILSDNKNEVEKFYMMEAILSDVIPRRLAMNSRLDCFDEDGHLKYDEENKPKIKAIHDKIMPLEEYNNTPKHETASQFFNLLRKLLTMKSPERVDSYTALHHPFFNQDGQHKEYEPIITPTKVNLEAVLRNSSRPLSYKMKDDPELRRLCGARALVRSNRI